MQTSEQINEIAAALADAQAEFPKVTKGKTARIKSDKANYEYKYADLGEVIETVRGTLTKNGLSVVQFPSQGDDSRTVLVTMLMHKSGQWIRGAIPILWNGGDPKQLGSLLTYLRRYCYTGAIGVAAEEDDDGHAASAQTAPQSPPNPRLPPKAAQQAPNDAKPPTRADGPPAADDVGIEYVNAQGEIEHMPLDEGIARLRRAHGAVDKLNNVDWFNLFEANKGWLDKHAWQVAAELSVRG